MYYKISNLVTFIAVFTICNSKILQKKDTRSFPDGFIFGVATASYQIEGGWDEDGKSESIWDHETHQDPNPIHDNSTGDIAADSYHLYKRDVEMMRELGLDFYRFSISWTRILPTSFPDKINEAGVAYYNNLINEMLKYNIQPMVTLYHWDLPQKLQELGGWTNPYVVDWYTDYARVLFESFGDRVQLWITFNEPHGICYYSYGYDYLAPSLDWPGIPEYMCAKNVLLAHAKVYHMYKDEYKSIQGGKVGIAISAPWYEPESEEHVEAADDAGLFDWGMYSYPIFSETGDFPQVIKDRIAAKSAEQGFPRSRLPEFTSDEIDLIRGTGDFLGLNHYTTYYVYRNESVNGFYEVPSFADDLGIMQHQPPEWQLGEYGRTVFPTWGFYNILTKVRELYNNPQIYITENGMASYGGLVDDDRVQFYRLSLGALLDAIDEGSDVRGYAAWSIMDSFEWRLGYTLRFGLYEMDYESPERTRTPRKSAFAYKEILRSRTLDNTYEPDDNMIMSIDEGH